MSCYGESCESGLAACQKDYLIYNSWLPAPSFLASTFSTISTTYFLQISRHFPIKETIHLASSVFQDDFRNDDELKVRIQSLSCCQISGEPRNSDWCRFSTLCHQKRSRCLWKNIWVAYWILCRRIVQRRVGWCTPNRPHQLIEFSSPHCRDATSEEIHRGPEARSQS